MKPIPPFTTLDGEFVRMILCNAVRIASRVSRDTVMWGVASDVFGVGSTSGTELCILAGLDPWEMARKSVKRDTRRPKNEPPPES